MLFGKQEKRTRAAFEKEALPHLDALFSVALRLTRNERDAEDLVQDTMLRGFHFFDRFEPGTNCKAWLFRILHNLFVNKYRRRVREREVAGSIEAQGGVGPTLSVEAKDEADDPERRLLDGIDGLLSDDVKRALDETPEDFRLAVVLCDLEELSYKEIAEVMDCPVGTVMSRLHRGRRLLQEKLRDYAAARGIGAAHEATQQAADEAAAESDKQARAEVIPIRRDGKPGGGR